MCLLYHLNLNWLYCYFFQLNNLFYYFLYYYKRFLYNFIRFIHYLFDGICRRLIDNKLFDICYIGWLLDLLLNDRSIFIFTTS